MLKKLQHNKKILFHLQKNIKRYAVMLTHSGGLIKKYKEYGKSNRRTRKGREELQNLMLLS